MGEAGTAEVEEGTDGVAKGVGAAGWEGARAETGGVEETAGSGTGSLVKRKQRREVTCN